MSGNNDEQMLRLCLGYMNDLSDSMIICGQTGAGRISLGACKSFNNEIETLLQYLERYYPREGQK